MYIKTQENKIINFNHYRSVEVYEMSDTYVLRAILSIGFEDKSKYDDIATFDDKETATKALDHLFVQIHNDKPAWNAKDYKNSVGIPTPILYSKAERKYP